MNNSIKLRAAQGLLSVKVGEVYKCNGTKCNQKQAIEVEKMEMKGAWNTKAVCAYRRDTQAHAHESALALSLSAFSNSMIPFDECT